MPAPRSELKSRGRDSVFHPGVQTVAGLLWGLKMAYCNLSVPAESQHSARTQFISGEKIKQSLQQ